MVSELTDELTGRPVRINHEETDHENSRQTIKTLENQIEELLEEQKSTKNEAIKLSIDVKQ